MQATSRVGIGPVPFDAVTMGEAISRVFKHLESGNKHVYVISGANAHFVNVAHREERFADVLRANHLNVADGAGVVLASRVKGRPLPERVTGIDLMIELCREASAKGRTIYLLGGKDGAAEKAAQHLQRRFSRLKIVGVDRPPIGLETNPEVVEAVRSRIREAKPDFLFVCFGVPRQEFWIHSHVLDLPVGVAMGNGAALDVLAGYFRRPPKWIQTLGFEWLYRLSIEPRRLWKRYLIGNLRFALAVMIPQEVEGAKQPNRARVHERPKID